jgi:hypothetical protein
MTHFNRDLKEGGEKATKTLGQQLKGVFSKENLAVAGVAGGLALAGAITAGLAGAVKSLIDIERLNAQTQSAIRATGGVANVTLDGIESLSEGLESLTTTERETVQEGANLLLTFKRIRNEAGAGNDIFNQATATALDLSTALGTDMRSASMMLGKALDDPIRGVTALRRAGVALTEQQQDQIKAFVESGDVLQAQKIILAELESQVGGSAEAFAGTTAGKIQRFQNDVGNMFESIVLGAAKVADAAGDAGDAVGDFFAEPVTDSMVQVNNAVATNMGGVVETMEQASKRIREDWQGTADFIPDAIESRWADTRVAAFQMAVEHAKGVLDGQNQIKVAFEVLTQLQEEEQTRAQRISYLQGLLSSTELADGLIDGRPGVSGAARALRAAAVAELAGLGVDAYNSGAGIPRQLAAGMYANAHLLDKASSYLAAKVSGYLPRSEPKEGPLRGITKVGHAIVSSITDGIYSSLDMAGGAAGALAGALVPSLAMPAMGMAGMEGMAGGPTWIVNVNGVQRSVGSPQEAIDALVDLGAFSEGRL